MKTTRVGFLAPRAALMGGLLCLGPAVARAQSLTVSASPALMRISTATAGLAPNAVSNAVTTYSVSAKNKANPVKVMGSLNSVMPPGMTLTIDLAPTTGATDPGIVTLDATARELMGNITNGAVLVRSITYTLSATPAAGVVSGSRIVTFTLLAWP